MMFLFRSTFITAISAFVMALCLFSMSASAVPQFGRPMLHALDAVTTPSGLAEAVPSSTATSPDPDPQVVEATSSSSSSSSSSTSTSASSTAITTPTASSTSTNGASGSLRGGISVMLGVVVSGVWLAF